MTQPKKIQADFFNGWDTEKSILIFDESKKCEHCNIIGSYVVKDDPIIGLCFVAVKEQYTNIEVLEK